MTNTKTQCRETHPWQDSRNLGKWSAGGCPEADRHGMIREGRQGGLGGPMAIYSSPTVPYRNAGLELNKTGFRVVKSTKNNHLRYVKHATCSKLRCSMNCRPMKKKQGFQEC